MPWVAGGGDAAEGRRAQEIIGQVEVRVVEEVKGLGAKLKIQTFAQRRVLHQRDVYVLKARAVDNVPAGVAKGARRGERECARIEPLLRRPI